MSHRKNNTYLRADSHSSQAIQSLEAEEKSHTINSMSEPLSRDPSRSYADSLNPRSVHLQMTSTKPNTRKPVKLSTNDTSPELQEVRIFEHGYATWPGKNLICCKGHIIGGPEVWKLAGTLAVIIMPTIFYLSFTARILWIDYDNKAPMIGGALLFVICTACLIVTAEMDPGIIPRPNQHERPFKSYPANKDFDNKNNNGFMHSYSYSHSGMNVHFPFRQTINVDGHIVTHKYCHTCQIVRYPRSFHCQVCNNCIERFDHHCPWVGNCIGLRNYNYFLSFLLFLNIYVFYVASYAIILLKHGWLLCGGDCSSSWHSFKFMCQQYPWTLALVIFEVIIFWFPVALLSFHLWISSTGQTTYEKLRSRELNSTDPNIDNPDNYAPELRFFKFASPYSLGLLGNLWNVFVEFPVRSNLHLRHKPPNIERVNEAIINKRTVIYLKPDDIQHTLDKLQSSAEQQRLIANGTLIEEEDEEERCSPMAMSPHMVANHGLGLMDIETIKHQKLSPLPQVNNDPTQAHATQIIEEEEVEEEIVFNEQKNHKRKKAKNKYDNVHDHEEDDADRDMSSVSHSSDNLTINRKK